MQRLCPCLATRDAAWRTHGAATTKVMVIAPEAEQATAPVATVTAAVLATVTPQRAATAKVIAPEEAGVTAAAEAVVTVLVLPTVRSSRGALAFRTALQ